MFAIVSVGPSGRSSGSPFVRSEHAPIGRARPAAGRRARQHGRPVPIGCRRLRRSRIDAALVHVQRRRRGVISGAILLLLLSTFVVDRTRPTPESPGCLRRRSPPASAPCASRTGRPGGSTGSSPMRRVCREPRGSFISAGRLTVDGVPASQRLVAPGSRCVWTSLNRWRSIRARPDIPLRIVYEDDDLLDRRQAGRSRRASVSWPSRRRHARERAAGTRGRIGSTAASPGSRGPASSTGSTATRAGLSWLPIDAAQQSLMAQLKARHPQDLPGPRGWERRCCRRSIEAPIRRDPAPDADGGRAGRPGVGDRLSRPRTFCRWTPRASTWSRRTHRSASISTPSVIHWPATPCTGRERGWPGRARPAVPPRWRLELAAPGDGHLIRATRSPGSSRRRSTVRDRRGGSVTERRDAPGLEDEPIGSSSQRTSRTIRAVRTTIEGAPGAILVIISGPSGVGKDTIIDEMRRREAATGRDGARHYVVTVTTGRRGMARSTRSITTSSREDFLRI